MGRTPGATNRTPREIANAGKWALEKAKLLAENQELKRQLKEMATALKAAKKAK